MMKRKCLFACLFLLCCLSLVLLTCCARNGNQEQDLLSEDNQIKNEVSESLYLDNLIQVRSENQPFFGTWVITAPIGTDFATPSSHSAFDENGNFKGKTFDSIKQSVVSITHENIVCNGVTYQYAENYTPKFVVLPVKSKNGEEINQSDYIVPYYKDETLGFAGDFVPYMHFALSENPNVTKEVDYSESYQIWHFHEIYLKDQNTAYISDGIQLFLMERVG